MVIEINFFKSYEIGHTPIEYFKQKTTVNCTINSTKKYVHLSNAKYIIFSMIVKTKIF